MSATVCEWSETLDFTFGSCCFTLLSLHVAGASETLGFTFTFPLFLVFARRPVDCIVLFK